MIKLIDKHIEVGVCDSWVVGLIGRDSWVVVVHLM